MSDIKYNTFQVTHPDLGTVQVAAVDKYAAVIAAAKEWGECWTQIAKDCAVTVLGSTIKTLCQRCKRVWVDKPGYCPQCQALINSRRREVDRLSRNQARQRRQERR